MASMLKGKYMPLSEADVSPVRVASYDGQHIRVSSASCAAADARFVMGNYLGGGIAGVVYEAYDRRARRHVAIKILNPVGYKLTPPATLRRGEVVRRGAPVAGHVRGMTLDNVYWVSLPHRRDLVACYALAPAVGASSSSSSSPSAAMPPFPALTNNSMASAALTAVPTGAGSPLAAPVALRELTLEMCVSLWLLDHDDDELLDDDDADAGEAARRRRGVATREDPVNDSAPPCDAPTRHRGHRHAAPASLAQQTQAQLTRRTRAQDEQKACDEGDEDAAVNPQDMETDDMCGIDDDDDGRGDNALPSDEAARRRRRRAHHLRRHYLDDDQVVVKNGVAYTIPRMPAKFRSFLRARKTIYREIAHMHKLTGNSVSGDQIGGGHENVLKLYDVLELVQPSKSTIFLVLELAYGGELFDRIRGDQGVDEGVARGYVAQLLAGVLYCHQLGIVHRDLKPENLLLSETDVLKIADFGLSAHFIAAVSGNSAATSEAMEVDDDVLACPTDNDVGASSRLLAPPGARFRRLNSIVGSPHYVAPEVLQNARYGYDGRKADMWSIGVILYGLLIGNLPFGKDLATCPRYLKFCEWVRSLPSDPHSGKLVFQPELFQPGSVRLVSSNGPSSAPGTAAPASSASDAPQPPPLHPGYQGGSPMLGMVLSSSSMLWNASGQSNNSASVPPVAPAVARMRSGGGLSPSSSNSSNNNSNNNNSVSADATSVLVANGAVGRRGSRVVSFPGWFFPARLSPAAVFLLASLLHPDPARRYSCEDASKSAWLADASCSSA